MKKLNHCNKAEIFDEGKQLLCTAGVEVDLMDNLLLTVPQSFDDRQQESYQVIFYDAVVGLLTCQCKLRAPVNRPNDTCTLLCEILKEISQEQRRMDVKVALSIPVEILAEGDKKKYPATLLNISAGGAYVTSELALEKGERFSFDFNELGTKQTLTAQVLWTKDCTEEAEDSGDSGKLLCGYGCRFVKLSPQREEQLRSYVFQQETRRLQSRRMK